MKFWNKEYQQSKMFLGAIILEAVASVGFVDV